LLTDIMIKREELEGRELEILAPYAAMSAKSKGRRFSEKEAKFRTCFQRDRDRVIHSKAFRRLNGKTQVFISGYGDHYRSRLTHSMEVAQFGRDIARMLNLNQDLAEAIGLAHDLGHTPFGHAGQEAMHSMMEDYGSRFEHNEQSFRIVNELELKSGEYNGLNLSFEVLDGLLKHRTRYDRPETFDHLMPSLEAQVVNIADEIAYQSHDIDDGLRSGILKPEGIKSLSIWKLCKTAESESDVTEIRRHQMVTSLMSLLVNDLAINTEKRLENAGIKTIENIYAHSDSLSSFSDEVSKSAGELKDYLYKNFYNAPEVMKYNDNGKKVIRTLFHAIYKNPSYLPEKYQSKLNQEEKHLVIKDYIAGMTDSFAMELYSKITTSD